MKKYLTIGLVIGLLVEQSGYAMKCDFVIGSADQIKTNLTSEAGIMYCTSPTIYINSDGIGYYSCQWSDAHDPLNDIDWYDDDLHGKDGVGIPGVAFGCYNVQVPGCDGITFQECGYLGCEGLAAIDVCTDSKNWGSYGDEYQIKFERSCVPDYSTDSTSATGICKEHALYQCAPGYYGTPNGLTGCTRCPAIDDLYGTSPVGSVSVTACYMPAGTPFTDATGSGTFLQNCSYTN